MALDPYRVLGVERGTPIAEIKRAYRRLAKANHPDAVGPAALPRFLEIQAAYEEIVGGRAPSSLPGGSSWQPGQPAWRADPDRARATREGWRRRTSRPGATGGPTGGSSRSAGGATGSPGRTGAKSSTDDDARGGASGGDRSGRGARNRATMGSTTYDGADREAFDPSWGGASWYGPTSGTYWTLNPKEYADPRKHGPEYQARARRSAGAPRIEEVPDGDGPRRDRDDPQDGPAPDRDDPLGRPTADAAGGPQARTWRNDAGGRASASRQTGPQNTGAGSRRTTEERSGGPTSARPPSGSAAPGATAARTAGPGVGASGTTGFATAPPGPDLAASPDRDRSWPAWRPPARLLAAIIAWPPLGLASVLIHGELTGCARFAATCTDATTPWPWVFQVAIIAFFLALPGLARIATAGTYAIVVVIVPVTLFLTAGGGYDPERSSALLFGSLAVAWLAGVIIGISRRWGREASRPHVP